MSTSFTIEELEKIHLLRQRVAASVELSEEQSSDHYLVKWLRARGMDVGKAEEMLKKSLEWRKENGIDTILETLKVSEHFLKAAPFAYLGIDPETGCPLFLYVMGRADMRAHVEELGIEAMLQYNAYFMEYIHKVIFKECSEKAGRPITQFIELMDLEGYNYYQLASSQTREMMTRMQVMFDSNYPEVVRHASMINAPKIFSVIFNLLKPFIAKATLDKVSIYGPNNWQAEVKERFPMELIPTHYGGSRPGRDEFCSGDPMWIFGLDKDFFKDLDVIKVKARDKVHLEFDVSEEGSILAWRFKSEGHDIMFGIFHEEVEVFPVTRVDSHKEIQSGELACLGLGKYTVVFDNTYSYTKGKQVHQRIEVISPFTNLHLERE